MKTFGKHLGFTPGVALVAMLLSGCISGTGPLAMVHSAFDFGGAISRTVPVVTPPTREAISHALQSIPADRVQEVSTNDVTFFLIQRGAGFAQIRLAPRDKAAERLVLYAAQLSSDPPSSLLASNRALLDEIYNALYTTIPGLPAPQELKER